MSTQQQIDHFCRTVALIIRRLLDNNTTSTQEETNACILTPKIQTTG